MSTPAALKELLPHTWPAFFARHGNFTTVQQLAIPEILAGRHTLVMAATAAGKTEAALAPLVERYLSAADPTAVTPPALVILYICPTRALVRDLYERLAPIFESLQLTLSMKSGDTGPVSLQQPPVVLITTPESTDSLLTRGPRLFTTLRALVLDEIHLFDNGPRGDHLRCLLRRIEIIHDYHRQQQGEAQQAPFQRVALSATVPSPTGVALRYLTPSGVAGVPNNSVTREDAPDDQAPDSSEFSGYQSKITNGAKRPQGEQRVTNLHYREQATPDSNRSVVAQKPIIIDVGGWRQVEAEVHPLFGLEDLVSALALRAGRGSGEDSSHVIRKSLLFCNTRNEVEQAAAYLRRHLPFAAEIFVHYSNLDPALRLEVEERFAAAGAAICVCSSTLELGIDIGSVDDVVLVGPPPTVASFLQRIGRGARRRAVTPVLCLPRSALEEARFFALLGLAQTDGAAVAHARAYAPTYHFRPSVLVQQIFSILKQSPTAGIRLADLRRVAPAEMNDEELRRILSNLVHLDYLQPRRPGEWRSGPRLDELVDAHEIYSNIGAEPLATAIVDAYSGRVLAQTNKVRIEGETLLMGGKVMKVVWRDRYRIGVRQERRAQPDESLRFQSAPFAVPLEVSQAVARRLQLAPNELCLIHSDNGVWLFHFWGDLYGTLLASMLQAQLAQPEAPVIVTARNELCLQLPYALTRLPVWQPDLAVNHLYRLLPRVEAMVDLGRFHNLLPPDIGEQTVVAQCDLPRFEQLYRAAMVVTPASGLRARLLELVHG
ncbi:MAG: DEAD/DEAH box helicase [Caldilineaceae bacterium]